MRRYSGKLLLRVPGHLHQELAKEAFETGRSINQLCLEALLARKALKGYDPWKSIEVIWQENRNVDPKKLEKDISQALREVRNAR
jgi:HicB family